jgi:hypothetical protein
VLLEDAHERADLHGLRVPQVVHPELRLLALFPALRADAGLGGVQAGEAPLDHVIDEGEVTCQLGLVGPLEDLDGLAVHDVAGEGEVGHVGPAPGPVHSEESGGITESARFGGGVNESHLSGREKYNRWRGRAGQVGPTRS